MKPDKNKQADKFLPQKGRRSFLKNSSVSSNRAVSIIKLIIVIFLLPLSFGNSFGFLSVLSSLDRVWVVYFWAGVFSFFVLDLAVYKLNFIYKRGQKIVEVLFSFFSPLVKFAPFVLPIFTILILIFSAAVAFFGAISLHQRILLFLTGFSIVLHLVYTADALRQRPTDFLRASHFFSILFIYLFNLVILAATIDRILPEQAFLVEFLRKSAVATTDIYSAIFNQFFLVN